MSIELPSFFQDKSLSAYELQRLENIKEIKKELGGLILEVQESASNLARCSKEKTEQKISGHSRGDSQHWRPKKKSRKQSSNQIKLVRRSARIRHETRISYNDQSEDDNDEDGLKKKFFQGSLVVKFPWFKTNENKERDIQFYSALNDSDFLTDDESDSFEYSPKRRRLTNSVPIQLPASQITTEMINNVHFSSSGKKYGSNGTTCHQCRQKTLDQKSYCRHKKCRGVRGMFCGFCLGKRYGENVAEVLLLKKWACPPCRGYCNCSICRRRKGKAPTGQLASIAQAQGFKSVRHMLVETEGENPTILTSDEEEEQQNISEINENKNEIVDIFKSEKSNDIEFEGFDSEIHAASRNSEPDYNPDLKLHIGYKFGYDESFFKQYINFPSNDLN